MGRVWSNFRSSIGRRYLKNYSVRIKQFDIVTTSMARAFHSSKQRGNRDWKASLVRKKKAPMNRDIEARNGSKSKTFKAPRPLSLDIPLRKEKEKNSDPWFWPTRWESNGSIVVMWVRGFLPN